MVMSVSSAISAYQNAARAVFENKSVSDSGRLETATTTTGEGFAGMVKGNLQDAVNLGKQSEKMTMMGLAGEAEMRDVVLAVNNAENALNTVVAIRDKVVNAYQEILRMPI